MDEDLKRMALFMVDQYNHVLAMDCWECSEDRRQLEEIVRDMELGEITFDSFGMAELKPRTYTTRRDV